MRDNEISDSNRVLNGVRILLDTNIVIPLEDSSQVLEESLSLLTRLAHDNGHQLIVHPASYDDINRDADIQRRTISMSRIRKYSVLQDAPALANEERVQLGLRQHDENDRVDNVIVYAIYRDAANILISEDRGIHKKAASIGIGDRVHYIQQAAAFLENLHARVEVALPNIEEVPIHQLDLASSFFDSLRAGYPGFDEWYRRTARSGRSAWVHRDDHGQLGAIAIYKEEINPIVTDENRALRGRVLKLCTFKVGESLRGRKLGELLLKASFRYATCNNYEFIYLTMRPDEQEFLQDLCEDFGFYYYGRYSGDAVFVKDHPASPPVVEIDAMDYHRRFYPHFRCDEAVAKFIVPIRPEFHEILFPDIQNQPSLFVTATAGNAIKQAYLSHARILGIKPGDILLFYRSHDQMAITSIGIVEMAEDLKDRDKILQLVSKRTVYSYEDIESMAHKKTKVILFRLAIHLQRPISYKWLLEFGMVRGQIQTIRRIDNVNFGQLVNEWGIVNCFYADQA